MAKNGKGKKSNAPDPQAPETQPKAGTPIGTLEQAPKLEPEIQAEFIGTVQPKYKTDNETLAEKVVEKIEDGATNEAKAVYKLAKKHKIVMEGLASALAISIIIAVILSASLQATSGRAAALSSSYNSISAQNSQLSSQLSNLSDYNTNFSRLRGQLVSLQSALSNKNITVQDLHYTITSMSQQLSNVTNQINAQNSTIFNLQMQVHNLTNHLYLNNKETILPRSSIQLSPNQNYVIKFLVYRPGVVIINISDPYSFSVAMNDKQGTFFTFTYPGASSGQNVTIPVYGTPSEGNLYVLTVTNLGSQSVSGSLGITLND